jgi:hypothetical protein
MPMIADILARQAAAIGKDLGDRGHTVGASEIGS